jgi:hypothetical protein
MQSSTKIPSVTNGFIMAPIDGSVILITTRAATARVPCRPIHSIGLRIALRINAQKTSTKTDEDTISDK